MSLAGPGEVVDDDFSGAALLTVPSRTQPFHRQACDLMGEVKLCVDRRADAASLAVGASVAPSLKLAFRHLPSPSDGFGLTELPNAPGPGQ